jgi:hypothetical protein
MLTLSLGLAALLAGQEGLRIRTNATDGKATDLSRVAVADNQREAILII